MNRSSVLVLLLIFVGCAHGGSELPLVPRLGGGAAVVTAGISTDSHMLWGFYKMIFSDDHERCEIVPVREAGFHLNAVKFLEVAPCSDCVKVTNLIALGGGVVELKVTIRHPFQQPIYSAFDVRGIIMFDGSWKLYLGRISSMYPELWPSYLSWARLGDWELLNPDGYSFRWSPVFNPDSQWPITRYYPGRLSVGTPTATINAYRDFYTDEERHLFRAGGIVTRTYRIQTQPGPMVVGYAVDACWEPPIVTPVIDPLADFPPSANCPEPYHFEVNINDGKPVVDENQLLDRVSGRIKLYIDQWNGITVERHQSQLEFERPDEYPSDDPHQPVWPSSMHPLLECKNPCGDNCFCGLGFGLGQGDAYPDNPSGWYRLIVVVYNDETKNPGLDPPDFRDHAIAVSDFYYDPY